jgi:hypothetical protein
MLVRERIDPHFSTASATFRAADTSPSVGLRTIESSRRRIGNLLAWLWPCRTGSLRRLSKSDVIAAMISIGAIGAISANGLMLQSGPHPAPIFAIRPLPVASREATGAITQMPRPRPAAPAEPAKPEAVHRTEAVRLPPPRPRLQSAELRADPIADIINPARQLSAVQRLLNEFGYGPIKTNGALDSDTRDAIGRFERDHNLPVTGQNSPRLRQALGSATGRSVE